MSEQYESLRQLGDVLFFVWSRNKWNHRLLFYDQEKCKKIPGTLIDVGNSKAKLYQQVQLQKLNVLYKDI